MEPMQLEGAILFGLETANVDHGDAILSVTLQLRREEVPIAATWRNAESSSRAGTRSRTAVIEFYSDHSSAASFVSLLEAAYESESGELKFKARPADGVVSAANPEYSGTLIVNSLDLLGKAGTARVQTQPFKILAGTYDKVTS